MAARIRSGLAGRSWIQTPVASWIAATTAGAPTSIGSQLADIVIRFNGQCRLVAHFSSLMRVVFTHALADVAADCVHEFAVNAVFEHASNGEVPEIMRTQISKAGDSAQVVP